MNQWAFILGASSGIGAKIAIELAKKGLNIYGVYLRKPAGHIEKLIEEISQYNVQVIFKKINAANSDSRIEVIDELNAIEKINIKIFVHSLAFGALKPMININSTDRLNKKHIDMTLDVMAGSFLYWSQEMFKSGIIKEGSQLMGMTSSGGRRVWQSYGAVSMAKAGLESASRQLAFELAQYGIASNTIQAGVTDTPALRKIPGNEVMIENTLKINPSKRLTTPLDVAKIITLLGLSEHTWMTGNTNRVDGGEDITG